MLYFQISNNFQIGLSRIIRSYNSEISISFFLKHMDALFECNGEVTIFIRLFLLIATCSICKMLKGCSAVLFPFGSRIMASSGHPSH